MENLNFDGVEQELRRMKKERKFLSGVRSDENLAVLGENTASIAHIFRNKLSIIGGFAENIFERSEEGGDSADIKLKKIKKAAGIIFKETMYLEKFVDELLLFSNIKGCITLEKGNINQFIVEMVKALNLEKKSINPVFILEKNLDGMLVHFDQRQLGVVIHDIVRNAIEAGADKVLLETSFRPEHKIFKVVIGNNGKEISSDYLENIFTPFFTTKPKGTGLGLANAAKIVEAHGGEIQVKIGDKTKEEFRTLFEVSMPLNN